MRPESAVSDIAWQQCGDELSIVMTGEVDALVVQRVAAGSWALLDTATSVQVDLSAVSFLDSSAVGLLVTAAKAVSPKRVRLAGAGRRVVRVLEAAGVTQLFDVAASAVPPAPA